MSFAAGIWAQVKQKATPANISAFAENLRINEKPPARAESRLLCPTVVGEVRPFLTKKPRYGASVSGYAYRESTLGTGAIPLAISRLCSLAQRTTIGFYLSISQQYGFLGLGHLDADVVRPRCTVIACPL